MTSASTYSWPITFSYDLAGDRTAITWWDKAAAAYSYDTDGEMTSIASNAPNAPVSLLASYAYDDLGRRSAINRGNGVSTAYGYDGISRLTSLTHAMVGGNAQSQTSGLGYNEASQINTLSQSNGVYQWTPSNGPPSFDGEFQSLSLWNGSTGAGSTGAGSTGVWATNYGWGGNPDSVAARTLSSTGEVELYVDPSLTGTGTAALGLNPYGLSNGILTLHAGPTPTADVASIWGYKFTSGMISTNPTFTQTYGYFEAEMQLPSGQGNWPAFWLYAVNGDSELDVMEEQNGSNLITGTAHNNGQGSASTGVTNTIPNLTAGFHKFGVLWTPTTITWYVDRVSIGSVATPSNLNSPMYMIADLALNASTPSTYAGGALQIGYIRAYTLANSPVSNQSLTYSVNGLNQLVTSAGAKIGYDLRGNLNSDSVNSYSYDILNRLLSTGPVGAAASVTTVYDPEDRLLSLTQGATTTQFAYVGPDVATEFNGATNQILRRYVPGPAEDEPVVWFEGSDGAAPRWLLQDHQGSVVAVTDMTGGALAVNTYSDYGAPGASNLGRYQFTGQFYLPEVGLYDYKARLYSPAQARFMQTDPVGYGDGLNWYDYVGNDPVNKTDPSGNCPECEAAAEEAEEVAAEIAESPAGRAVEGFAERGLQSLEEGLGIGGKPSAPSAPSEFDAPRPEVHFAEEGKTYQTYTKANPETGEVYTGRTSGTGSPEQNIARRDQGHDMNDKGFGPARLDKSSSNPQAIRGREQQMIEKNGGAQSSGGASGNRINGISPKNPNGVTCRAAANKEFGGC